MVSKVQIRWKLLSAGVFFMHLRLKTKRAIPVPHAQARFSLQQLSVIILCLFEDFLNKEVPNLQEQAIS